MRLAVLCVLLVVLVGGAAPARAAEQAPGIGQDMSDFDRNTALGAVLEMRPDTQAELDELRLLADRGLNSARAAVAASPDSADAQYGLGSWLLYGYRVVEVDQISLDAEGNAQTERVTRVVQGMDEDPEEGLTALRRATELAPANGQYLLDYSAALMDCDRPDQAEGILKGVWAGQPDLPLEDKMRAGILLSVIAAGNGDLDGAREWVYSALSLDSMVAPAIAWLREIDEAALAAALAPPPAAEWDWEEEQSEAIEGAPSVPEEGAEESYEEQPEQGYQDEGYYEPEPETGNYEEPQPPTTGY